ncbi:unnamed protein product [Haemonchus placei]|uniref:Uncharacterized protein n=1 Tax=Haemonchus placei TaxID=6290 RepID=A0A3P7Y2Y4_HAEPC|nr:unnamed protein product [Haemonchus placei]
MHPISYVPCAVVFAPARFIICCTTLIGAVIMEEPVSTIACCGPVVNDVPLVYTGPNSIRHNLSAIRGTHAIVPL